MNLKKIASRTALIYCAVFILVTVMQIILIIPASLLIIIDPMLLGLTLSYIPLYLFGIPLAFYMFKRIPDCESPSEKKRLDFKSILKYFPVSYAFLIFGSTISTYLEGILSNMMDKNVMDPVSEIINSDISKGLLLLFTVVAAPIAEEFLFRYLPCKKLSGFGNVPYMLLTSVCFAFFHMNFFQGIYAFFVGLVLAHIFLQTRNISYCIILHMLINFVGSVVAPMSLASDVLSFIFGIFVIAVTLTGILTLVIYLKKTEFAVFKEFVHMENKRHLFFNLGMIILFVIFLISSIANIFT